MRTIPVTLSALLSATHVSASPLETSVDGCSGLICGQTGYDAGIESFFGEDGVKQAFCAEQCTWQGCTSFAWGRGICQLYNVSASSNFIAVEDSIYTFYDSNCPTSATCTANTPSIPSAALTTTTTQLITTPAEATITASATNDPASQICWQRGYDAGKESFYDDAFIVVEGCENACAQYNCTSFAYGAGECHLYDVPAGSNFVASQDSWYNFFDASCFDLTYTPPIDPSQVCGEPCFFPDDHMDLHYYTTGYRDPSPEALSDCYQKCLTYDRGYCEGWLWRAGECELWSELPTPDDLRWHPMKSNYCWARDCGAPVVGAAESASTASITTTAMDSR